MNDSKTRSKLWRAKQKQETPNFVSKERERHRLFRMKKKHQLGGGQSSRHTSTAGGKHEPHSTENTNTEETEHSQLESVMSKTFELDAAHVILQHPFTMLVAGPTGSGKTYWVNRLLQHRREMITPPPEEILWYHGQRQPFHTTLQDTYPDLQLIDGLPDTEGYDTTIPRIIIIDGLMNELKGDVVANLFTKGSHHTNSSIIFIVQNLFSQNRGMRDISLNAHYLTLLKNPRDKQQITTLDSQMFPGRGRFLTQCYENATSNAHGYLFIATNQYTTDELRVRTQIFPDDNQHLVYVVCQ